MLTVAQMFLLNTCVALPFFSWMWSSAASATVVLPQATCAPCHGGDAPAWEDTPLCGSELAPHPLLGPREVTWEEAESPSWQVNILRPTSRWKLRMQHLKLVGSWGSQHSLVLPEIFQVKISFDWISWRRTNCWERSELWTLTLWCLLEDSCWNNWICGQHVTLGCSDPAAGYRETGHSWSAYKAHFEGWNQMIFKAPFPPKPFYDFRYHYHEVFYTFLK